MSLTASLTEVEPDEDANNASNDEQEANEVELCNVFTERLAVMRIKIQEEEEDQKRNPSSWPTNIRSVRIRKVCNRHIQVNEETPVRI